jgi:hypothetical protein
MKSKQPQKLHKKENNKFLKEVARRKSKTQTKMLIQKILSQEDEY